MLAVLSNGSALVIGEVPPRSSGTLDSPLGTNTQMRRMFNTGLAVLARRYGALLVPTAEAFTTDTQYGAVKADASGETIEHLVLEDSDNIGHLTDAGDTAYAALFIAALEQS